MKIEVNIDKKILLIVIGMLLIGAGVYASVNTSLPYHDASQTRLSNGDSVQDYVNKMSTFTSGNITLADSPSVSAISSTTYSLIKEIQVSRGGIINVSFDLAQCGSYDAYGKIYVNGVARGTERKTGSSSFRTYSEDIGVNASDKVQLYGRCGGTSVGEGTTKNFKVMVSNPIPIAVVTYEAEGSKF